MFGKDGYDSVGYGPGKGGCGGPVGPVGPGGCGPRPTPPCPPKPDNDCGLFGDNLGCTLAVAAAVIFALCQCGGGSQYYKRGKGCGH